MSNEYKDWVTDRLAEEKEIVAKYPFLRVRDIDGMPDVKAEFPMICLEIPLGWYKLFFQMCDDIKAALEKEGTADDFYFLQVKEKFNRLVCYSNGSVEVEAIIQKYGYIAQYVCTHCGKPATFQTSGYIASFCDDCWKDWARHEKGDWLHFSDTYKVFTISTQDKVYVPRVISVKEEWNRYLKNYTLTGTN